MKNEKDWKPGDLWLALLFLGMGALLVLLSFSLWKNGWHSLIAGLSLIPGILLALLGANALVKSLGSRED